MEAASPVARHLYYVHGTEEFHSILLGAFSELTAPNDGVPSLVISQHTKSGVNSFHFLIHSTSGRYTRFQTR
jgi:hypothetical protein